MIVMMSRQAEQKDIDYVVRRARSLGLRTHIAEQQGQTLIGLLGDMHGIDTEALQGLRGVERVQPMSAPFRLASLDFKTERTAVTIGDCADAFSQSVKVFPRKVGE